MGWKGLKQKKMIGAKGRVNPIENGMQNRNFNVADSYWYTWYKRLISIDQPNAVAILRAASSVRLAFFFFLLFCCFFRYLLWTAYVIFRVNIFPCSPLFSLLCLLAVRICSYRELAAASRPVGAAHVPVLLWGEHRGD